MGYPTDKNGEPCSAFHTGEERSSVPPVRATFEFRLSDAKREIEHARKAISDEITKQIERLRLLELSVEDISVEMVAERTIGSSRDKRVFSRVELKVII